MVKNRLDGDLVRPTGALRGDTMCKKCESWKNIAEWYREQWKRAVEQKHKLELRLGEERSVVIESLASALREIAMEINCCKTEGCCADNPYCTASEARAVLREYNLEEAPRW